ncbi:MAG: hypothetical protein ABWY58_14465 [Aeromicrobium sp.]
MHRTYRLPALLLAVVAIAATAVIGLRLAADADRGPQDDTSPVVLTPSTPPAPTPLATTAPTVQPGSDDDDDEFFDRTVPAPRDYDDDDDDPDDDDEPDDRDDD